MEYIDEMRQRRFAASVGLARRYARAVAVASAIALLPVDTFSQGAASTNQLRLDDVLAAAVIQHPLVDAARSRLDAAYGTRRTAGVLPNPVFTYWLENATFPGQRPKTPLDTETQLYATLPLEFLYQRGSRTRAASAGVDAATAELAGARQQVARDAARAFFRVAAAQVAVDGADDLRSHLMSLVTYNQHRVREGKAAEADLIRTQVEMDRAEANAALALVELARARAALAPYIASTARAAVGAPNASRDSAPAPLDSRFPDSMRVDVDDVAASNSAAPLAPLANVLATAMLARPDVVAARARVAGAHADATYQRAQTVRQAGLTFGSKRTLGVTSMIASLNIPFPLFDQNRGEIQRATALERAAQSELAWTERLAASEIRSAYAAARALSEQAARLRGSMLSRADSSRQIAIAAYAEGAVPLLQVIDASRTLSDARQSYYQLMFAQRESLLELRAASGEVVVTESATPDSATKVPGIPASSIRFRTARFIGDHP